MKLIRTKLRNFDHATLERWGKTRDQRLRPMHMTRAEWRKLGRVARYTSVLARQEAQA